MHGTIASQAPRVDYLAGKAITCQVIDALAGGWHGCPGSTDQC
jgi:hypothetical protein